MKILDRIKHFFGVHKYYKIKRLSTNCHQLGCIYCKKKFAMNTSIKCLLDWDQELEDFYYFCDKFETDYKGNDEQ